MTERRFWVSCSAMDPTVPETQPPGEENGTPPSQSFRTPAFDLCGIPVYVDHRVPPDTLYAVHDHVIVGAITNIGPK